MVVGIALPGVFPRFAFDGELNTNSKFVCIVTEGGLIAFNFLDVLEKIVILAPFKLRFAYCCSHFKEKVAMIWKLFHKIKFSNLSGYALLLSDQSNIDYYLFSTTYREKILIKSNYTLNCLSIN